MQLRALGPVSTVDANGKVTSLRGQQAEVLALLMAHHPQAVRADLLAEALWGDEAPASASTGLRVVVARLRDRFDDPDIEVVHDGDGYRLQAPTHSLDTAQFADLLDQAQARAQAADHTEAAALLGQALDLWRGRAFQQCENNAWLASPVAVLEQQRLDAQEQLIETLAAAGEHDKAAALASSAVTDEPFRERRWELLLLSLYASGRHAEALRAVQRARRLFGEELGLELSPRLVDLEARILAHDESLLSNPRSHSPAVADGNSSTDSSPPQPASLVRRRDKAPSPSSRFFGREDDLAELADLVAANGLVTVVGPGGAGKTRLVARFANSVGDLDLVWVDLVEPRICRTVAQCLAEQIGVRPVGDATELLSSLVDELSQRPTLLVIDNCEDDVAQVAALGEALLRQTPGLRVVATSRVGLASESEARLELAGLDDESARRLLVDRAFGSRPAPQVDTADLPRLIDSLDGLPLALELVAAQLRVLPVDELAALVQTSLDTLEAPNRTDVRHRRLADTIDGSLANLDADTTSLLEQLAVLNGRFTLADAATGAGPTADRMSVASQLQVLVDSSLVEREVGRLPAFRLLSTVRTRARERLDHRGELDNARDGHATAFAALVSELEPDLRGAGEELAVQRLNEAADHTRAAFEHHVSRGNTSAAADMAIGIHDWSILRLVWDNFSWAERVLGMAGADELDQLEELQACAALGAWAGQRFTDGERLAAASLQTSKHRGSQPRFRALSAQFNLASQQGRFAEAGQLQATLMGRPRFRSVPHEGVLTLGNLALGFVHAGMTSDALRAALECQPLAASSGNASLLAWAHYTLGEAQSADDPAEAARSFAESVRLSLTVDNRWSQGMAMSSSISSLRRLGRLDEAAVTTIEVLEHWYRTRFASNLRHAMLQATLVLLETGRRDAARRALGAVTSARSTHPLSPADAMAMDQCREALGDLPVGVSLDRRLLDETVEALSSR
ncbi:MAG: BTAD domain-containing putative transcriptional regulator [Acidimicrobiales bacterium]|nr:winged helix-turn-helix domain-containing protein [Acidimicrobiales bacterium]